jgi:methylthioribose-1-phosphate isomerase
LAAEIKAAARAAAQFLKSIKRAQEKAKEKVAVKLEKAKKAAEEKAARIRPIGDNKKSIIKFKDTVGCKFAFP